MSLSNRSTTQPAAPSQDPQQSYITQQVSSFTFPSQPYLQELSDFCLAVTRTTSGEPALSSPARVVVNKLSVSSTLAHT